MKRSHLEFCSKDTSSLKNK